MDPKQFLDYANQTCLELSMLAECGHRQFAEITDGDSQATAILAVGPEESAMLRKLMAKFEQDPEFIAFRASRSESAKANLVAALAPERN